MLDFPLNNQEKWSIEQARFAELNARKFRGGFPVFTTQRDIIIKSEFDEMSMEGLKIIYTLTRESNFLYENKRIDRHFIKEKIKDFKQYFYICGPIRFVGEITSILEKLGVNQNLIVVET